VDTVKSRSSGRGEELPIGLKGRQQVTSIQPVVLVVNRLAGSCPEARIEVGHSAVGGRAYAEHHASRCRGNRNMRGNGIVGLHHPSAAALEA
jgi:hypothetical protein